jgi:hypothetical protein
MRRRTCILTSLIPIFLCLFCLYYVNTVDPKSVLKNPPKEWQDSSLVGSWQTSYGRATDEIFIQADGTFKQIYKDGKTGYYFETPWNHWWVERLPNEITRIHLEGGRYFLGGVKFAELDGMSQSLNNPGSYSFYDPYSNESLDMVRQLILDVRMSKSGEIILHHMWMSSDRGFALIGGGAEIFRKEASTSSLR